VKVSELEGADLDRWAALAQGWELYKVRWWVSKDDEWLFHVENYTPSTDKAQAMELLIAFKIELYRPDNEDPTWEAEREWFNKEQNRIECYTAKGPTPMIAICRAVVASKFGGEVEQ